MSDVVLTRTHTETFHCGDFRTEVVTAPLQDHIDVAGIGREDYVLTRAEAQALLAVLNAALFALADSEAATAKAAGRAIEEPEGAKSG